MLLPSGDLYVSDQVNFNLYDGDGFIVLGGHVVFEGHGRTGTRIINIDPNTEKHAFLLGDSLEHRPPGLDGAASVGALVLRDLTLIGETAATTSPSDTFAVLRLWQGRSRNLLQNVTVRQDGAGHGIDCSDVFLGSFHEVTIVKDADVPGYSGRGLWLHTEEHPFFVSGEFELQRISAFGRWSEGIVIGENMNTEGRFYGGLSAQFLNAELCREGIVIGKGAADVDVSVVWVERNQRCGVRIYNGAKDVTIRRIYSWHTPGTSTAANPNPVDPDYPEPPIPDTFRGDVILGKVSGGGFIPPDWNRYEGVEIDGVFQHFIYGPAVLLHSSPGELRRDITIRNVRAGSLHTFTRGEDEILVSPFTDAVVKVDDGNYEGLFIERVRPYDDGGLPRQYPGEPTDPIVALIDRPDLVDRLVFAGPFDETFSFGVHEERNQANALRTRGHTSSQSLTMSDPSFHRIDASSGAVTITLPDIDGFGFVPERLGVEFHLMKVAGGAANTVTVQGSAGQTLVGQGVSGGAVVLGMPYDYVHVRSARHGNDLRWEVIGFYVDPNP